MAKLIFEKGVVEERADLNPVTGCWRVVYEKQGEGARFKCVLDEDEDFHDGKRGLAAIISKPFTTAPDNVVYAVSQDKHLLLDFTSRLAHQNQLNHFDLTFTLTYQVSDPKLLIERLRAVKDDPLTRLHDTVSQEVGGACARLAWEVITDEYEFAVAAAGLTAAGSPAARAVQSMARYLGLTVSDIRLGLRLLEADMQEARRQREHRFTLAERQRQLEVTRASLNIKDEEEKHGRRRDIADAITDSIKTMIVGTDNIDKLRNQVNSIGSLLPSISDDGAGAPPPDGGRKLLRERSSRGGGTDGSLLEEVVDLVSELDLRERERRKVLAAVYHLAAELLAADDSRPDALGYYQEKYRVRLDELMPELSSQQYDTLELLLNVEHL